MLTVHPYYYRADLAVVKSQFTTCTGKAVDLAIYAEAKNIDRCDFAMESLKRAMKWDEDRFGLEYDLDLFNIVAVDDFNMGAMENKSLNLFNSRLVLATVSHFLIFIRAIRLTACFVYRRIALRTPRSRASKGSSATSTSTIGPATA